MNTVGDNTLTCTDFASFLTAADAASGDVEINNEKEETVNQTDITRKENSSKTVENLETKKAVLKNESSKNSADENNVSNSSTSVSLASEINYSEKSFKDFVLTKDSSCDIEELNASNKKSDNIEKKCSLKCDSILTPLNLCEVSNSISDNINENDLNKKFVFSSYPPKMLDNETPCMLCEYVESNMDSTSHFNEYLCHLLVEHKLVIADVKLIADLQSYAMHWKTRFAQKPISEFCSKIRTNSSSKDIGKSEDYYLLCDALSEDKKIREHLQFDKLKKLLLRQEFERKDETFSHTCPFCNRIYQGNRIILFDHMSKEHSFNIGHPDNIVNVRELLDDIQNKLNKLQCLFCENIFRDRLALREHMRKKGHRQLNPLNKEYDKYYMINYLELGKNWQLMQSESERLDGSSDDWSGWYEEVQKAFCFYCNSSFDKSEKVYEHMKDEHNFNFVLLRQEMQLSFYQQIKLINYIRRQVYLAKQEHCEDVVSKIKDDLKSSTKWNQPQYYFSTYEDDIILCQIEDKEGLFEPEDTFVIGEDGIDCRTIINDSVLTDLVIRGYFDS